LGIISVLILFYLFLSSDLGSWITAHMGGHFVEESKHIFLTIGAVVFGALIDRAYLFGDLNKHLQERLSENSSELTATIREEIIPMSRDFGVLQVLRTISFRHIIESLEENDHIDIFFTFHPDIDQYLVNLVSKVTQNNVTCRLLLGNPNSPSLARRFNYITEAADGYKWPGGTMLDRLRYCVEKTLPNALSTNRDMANGKLLQVKSFDELPDIPLIIITKGRGYRERDRTGDGETPLEYPGDREIKRVLQGYYLQRPAMELPFIEWTAPTRLSRVQNMASLFLAYFDARWEDGTPISCKKESAQ
jgi:hypothetical protein